MFVNHISPDLDLIYTCVPISSFMGYAKSCVYYAVLVFTHIHGYSCVYHAVSLLVFTNIHGYSCVIYMVILVREKN